MKQPWPKHRGWPREGKRGKTWQLGYRDHEGFDRSKSFKTQRSALDWKRDYIEAERRNYLREFLLGSDAPEVQPGATPLREIVLDYLALDAHPSLPGGLAPSTYSGYKAVASRHIIGNPTMGQRGGIRVEVAKPAPYAVRIGQLPIAEFCDTRHIKPWLADLRRSTGPAGAELAYKVLSAILAWAVDQNDIPLQANGCKQLERKRGSRRSSRAGGTGEAPSARGKRREQLAAWALAPAAVEHIREQMLLRVAWRPPLMPARDAFFVASQHGLGGRNQDGWGLRIGDVREVRWTVADDPTRQKTVHSGRRVRPGQLLAGDLAEWLELLAEHGYPVVDDAYLMPGNIGDPRKPPGSRVTQSQAKKWGQNYFTPAVEAAIAAHPELAPIRGATPYAVRRGAISLRIRAGEDRQVIAKQCGTSVEMLERAYSFAIEDLEDHGPRPAEEERVAAREQVFGHRHRLAA